MEIEYKCNCNWIGTENEMGAGHYVDGDCEVWSNWICPNCDSYQSLDDYTIVRLNISLWLT